MFNYLDSDQHWIYYISLLKFQGKVTNITATECVLPQTRPSDFPIVYEGELFSAADKESKSFFAKHFTADVYNYAVTFPLVAAVHTTLRLFERFHCQG